MLICTQFKKGVHCVNFKQFSGWCMLSNTEQNKTESAVIEKLLTFKQVLETHPASNTLAHRFFLDVLKSILEETIHAIPFAFPVDEDTRTKYNFHLNQEVRLFHLPDDYELNQETIQKLLSFTYFTFNLYFLSLLNFKLLSE